MAPDPIAFSCLFAPRDQPVSFDLNDLRHRTTRRCVRPEEC